MAYNDNGNIAFVKDHTGRNVYYNYYCGNLTYVVDVDGNAHNYKYYENGLLKEIADPVNNTFITNFYDVAGRTVKQSFPDRSNMAYEYNDSNRTTILKERNGEKIVYYRDEDYQITEVRYFDGSEKFTYNKGNKLSKYIDKNNNIFQYEYTNSGQCNKETNPLGVKESFTYSETGNPTSYIKNNVELIKIGYDERDNIISLTDGEGNTTKYEYDSLNQVIKLTLPEGGETAFAYTPSGKNSIIINACSDKMEFTYDGAGNVISKKDFDGNITNYKYIQVRQGELACERLASYAGKVPMSRSAIRQRLYLGRRLDSHQDKFLTPRLL